MDCQGNKLTQDAIIDVSEVKLWSTYLTLTIIFEGISNAVDDVFMQKAIKYKSAALEARDKAFIRLDLNGDGIQEKGEALSMYNVHMIR